MKNKLTASFKNSDITFVVINLLIYRIFTQLPMTIFKTSGSAAPLSNLLSGIAAIGIIWFLTSCLLKNINGNLLDAAETLFGKLGKVLFCLLIIAYLAVSMIFTLENFSNLIRLIAFPTSPLWFVTIFLILGAVLGALGNTHSVIRLHGIFAPIIITVLVLLIVSTIYQGDTSRLFPLLGGGTNSVLSNSFSGIILYTDIILLLLIAPNGESRTYITKTVSIGAIFALLLNFLFALSFTLKIPQTIAQNQQFPIYLLMKQVYFGRFFQRLDALILLVSALSSMLYMSLNLTLIFDTFRQSLGFSQKPPVVIALGVLISLISLQSYTFPQNSILYLVYVCGFGVMAFSILAAIFAKVRSVLSEKK